MIARVQAAIARVMTPRALFGTALAAALATWVMLLIGGTVNPTGSSLACDWTPRDLIFPHCNGDAFPEMAGGVLFEHGHRLWGWLVGMTTVATLIGAWARPGAHPRGAPGRAAGGSAEGAGGVVARATKWMAFGALVMVLMQGLLGGLTVFFGLNPFLSTAHLVTGYGFLALMVVLAWRLAPSRAAAPGAGDTLPRRAILIVAGIVLLQIVLGGVIRHFGAGLVCGADPIGCQGHGLWPSHYLQQLHMSHRFLGYTVAALVVWIALRSAPRAKAAGRSTVARLALVPIVIVAAQVVLGLLTVMTGEVVAVAFHTAFGGLLLATMVALWAGFGPLGAPRKARANVAAPGSPGAIETPREVHA